MWVVVVIKYVSFCLLMYSTLYVILLIIQRGLSAEDISLSSVSFSASSFYLSLLSSWFCHHQRPSAADKSKWLYQRHSTSNTVKTATFKCHYVIEYCTNWPKM